MMHKIAVFTILFYLAACTESNLHLWQRSSKSHFHKLGTIPLCHSFPLPAATPSDLLAKLEPFLEEAAKNISAALKEDNSPGGAVVSVVYNDTVIWTKGSGLINDSGKITISLLIWKNDSSLLSISAEPSRGAPDGNTAFRIGSITKLFTAMMTLMLRDSGALRSIDENITVYLPQFSIKNRFQTKRGITFRQLMSHMAGLPRNPPCKGLFVTGCNLTDDQIYANLAEMELMYPPGEQPAYSNLGFGLLGRVLEQITQSKWEDAVQFMVFDTLGMNNSGNSFNSESVKQLAVGYNPDGTKEGQFLILLSACELSSGLLSCIAKKKGFDCDLSLDITLYIHFDRIHCSCNSTIVSSIASRLT